MKVEHSVEKGRASLAEQCQHTSCNLVSQLQQFVVVVEVVVVVVVVVYLCPLHLALRSLCLRNAVPHTLPKADGIEIVLCSQSTHERLVT